LLAQNNSAFRAARTGSHGFRIPFLAMLEAIFFFFIVVAGTGGELCVSRAMKSIGEVHDFRPSALFRFVLRALRLPWLWAGITLMALGFFSLLAILSFREVSFVVPVSALSYAAGALGAKLFLGERISLNRWLGIAVVTLGVTLVYLSRR
jgi:drug/metabolite transporter (DMT)-like permease